MVPRLIRLWFAVLLLGSVLGCAVGIPYQPPAQALPSQWNSPVGAAQAAAPVTIVWDQWWPAFGSDELNRLAGAAVAGNHEIAAAQSRVLQARALVAASRATLGPRLDARAGTQRAWRSGDAAESLHELGVVASFDPDLSGANGSAVDAAGGRVRQREFARESLGATLLVELCNQYFRALSASDRLAIARANIANAESLLKLLDSRQQAGAVASLEVVRQQGLLASLRSGLAPLEQQRQAAVAAVAVLTGRAPQGFDLAAGSLEAMRLPTLAAELPVQMLERHPDVRQAEAELRIAHADVNAARSAWVPQLRFGASLGLESATLASLFNGATVVSSIGANLLAPLFDAGRIRAQLGAATARQDEVTHLYHQAVLNALRDVEDNLGALRALAEQSAQQLKVVEFAQSALKMAELRYRNGATDYATVLDAQRVLLAAQDAQAVSHLARYSQTLALVRALGAGVPSGDRIAAMAQGSSITR
jgi:outer membrane protein, multidrug efflux system